MPSAGSASFWVRHPRQLLRASFLLWRNRVGNSVALRRGWFGTSGRIAPIIGRSQSAPRHHPRRAAALAAYARQRDDKDLEVWISEIKLRASVRIGELVRELETADRSARQRCRADQNQGGRRRRTECPNRATLPRARRPPRRTGAGGREGGGRALLRQGAAHQRAATADGLPRKRPRRHDARDRGVRDDAAGVAGGDRLCQCQVRARLAPDEIRG